MNPSLRLNQNCVGIGAEIPRRYIPLFLEKIRPESSQGPSKVRDASVHRGKEWSLSAPLFLEKIRPESLYVLILEPQFKTSYLGSR